jgi:predicted metal-binding protein
MIVGIESKIITYEPRIQALCHTPFYGHPRGCPNFGRKKNCPPNQLLINQVIDLSREAYVIYTKFNVGEFAERMRVIHPEWKDQPRQWYNMRRWQPKARKEHRYELGSFSATHPDSIFNTAPEAHGVNISALMLEIGIKLKWGWPPKHNENNKVYLISLGGREFKG